LTLPEDGGLSTHRPQTLGSLAPTPSATSVDQVEIRLKLLKWIFFEIIFALLPLVFDWADGAIHGKGTSLAKVLGRGELLLVSVAIMAAAIGDLVKGGLNSRIRSLKVSLVGFGMILATGATWLYAEVAVAPCESSGIAMRVTVIASICVASAAILSSVGCLIAAEVK
jgi:hypothetical protein